MPLVLAFTDIKPENVDRRERRGPGEPGRTKSRFFKSTRDNPRTPEAYVIQYDPGQDLEAHFHEADQFQIVMQGKGTFGRHKAAPYYLHFARAYTPYGPLLSDKETGWTFLTLRARFDSGAQCLPENYDKLVQIPARRPWQISKMLTFPSESSDISFRDIPEVKNEQGLFAQSFTLPAGTRIVGPNPSTGEGQYIVVLKGSLLYGNSEYQALTLVFIGSNEAAFQIKAGPQGLEGLILNFPQADIFAMPAEKTADLAHFKKWQCVLCAFSYDEALGMPDEGIPSGTRWEDVPDTWNCPDCSASKNDFQMIEV